MARGRSNHHIAVSLGISDRTVGKHLEHGFRKLGVSDRSTAAGRAWELAGGFHAAAGFAGGWTEQRPGNGLGGLGASRRR